MIRPKTRINSNFCFKSQSSNNGGWIQLKEAHTEYCFVVFVVVDLMAVVSVFLLVKFVPACEGTETNSVHVFE